MDFTRRTVLRATAGILTAAAVGVRPHGHAEAAEWNKTAFGARTVADAMKGIGATNPTPSKDIVIKAPDVAENGVSVPIEISSRIPDTESITILADRNPSPLIASFRLASGAEPYISLRIKLMESSNVRVVVTAGDRHFMAVREVKVTLGGCA